MYSLTKSQMARGWVEEVRGELAEQLGVTDGSYAVFYRDSNRIRVEIFSPPSSELVEEIAKTDQEFRETFEEMKRLGD